LRPSTSVAANQGKRFWLRGEPDEMVDRLSNLVAIFDTPALDFRSNRAEGDDLLGDAYEYLMRHFARSTHSCDARAVGWRKTPLTFGKVLLR
jgi:type I restriction enzyme M protein